MLSVFQVNKALPKSLTSYDLLKTLALLLMFADHVGYFFFPDESWFRVIGRLCIPIWFFLIGYANTREVQPMIWIGGVLVAISSVATGEYLFPLNILFTLAIARLWIDRVMTGGLRNYEAFIGMFCLLFFLSFPTMIMAEYGTMGLMFTVFGFLRRHKADITLNRLATFGYLFGIGFFFSVFSGILIPKLDVAQVFLLFGGVAFVMFLLFHFEGQEYSGLSTKLGVFVVPLQFMGRHTLAIYVIHIILFRIIALLSGDERFGLFEIDIMPSSFLTIIRSFTG